MRQSVFVRRRRGVGRNGLIIGGAAALLALTVGLWALHSARTDPEALAESDDASKRIEAIERLADDDGEQARRIIHELARDEDVWVARRAVRAIREKPVLEKIWRDRKVRGKVRAEAAVQLAKQKADPMVLARGLSPSVEPDAEARAGAAKGLSLLEEPKTIPQLVEALRDPDPRVRLWAIDAIHEMVVRRFPFKAEEPVGTQEAEIRRIEDYLRRCGVL